MHFSQSDDKEGRIPSPASSYIASISSMLPTASLPVVGNGSPRRTALAKAFSCISKLLSPPPYICSTRPRPPLTGVTLGSASFCQNRGGSIGQSKMLYDGHSVYVCKHGSLEGWCTVEQTCVEGEVEHAFVIATARLVIILR